MSVLFGHPVLDCGVLITGINVGSVPTLCGQLHAPCPPIDIIITLMIVWRITGKIIRTTIMLNTYARV